MDPSAPSRRFGWVDYLIFSLTLLVSALVGVYHAWKGASKSTSNYLLGGNQMGIFPVAMSLTASVLSANTLLGVPTDVYLTGTMYWWMVVSSFVSIHIASQVFLPVYHHLQVVSVYKYLELRFNSTIRRLACIIYITKQTIYVGILVYGPSLALKQVTGIDVYISVAVTFIVCTFYTAIGGFKAVVWTDTIQLFLMCASMIILLTKGVIDAGGIENVWELNVNSNRIEFFNFDMNPTTRHTVWSIIIGGMFFWTGTFSVNQVFVQRFLAMPTKKKAQQAMLLNSFGVGIVLSLCTFAGLVTYAKYFDCDPIKAKMVKKADQILPYFVMDSLGNYPGLPGLFVAGIFSGSLSSLSSALNSLGLVILEDFVRPFYPELQDKTATRITKGVSVVFAIASFGVVFLFSQVKSILDASLSISSAASGPLTGVFILGLLIPWANSIGAGIGLIASFSSMMTLGIFTQMAKSRGVLHNNQIKPLSTDGCLNFNSTISLTSPQQTQQDNVFFLLRISYMWYTLIGALIALVIGTLISFLTGPQNPNDLDPKLIFNFLFEEE